jgi:hypothetical protein
MHVPKSLPLLALLAAGAVAAPNARAAPQIAPACSLPQLSHPSGAAGLVPDPTCRTAFVKPPTRGVVQALGLVPSANAALCSTVSALQAESNAAVAEVKSASNRVEALIKDFEPLLARIRETKDELAVALAERDVATLRVAAAESKQLEHSAKERTAETELDDCVIIEGDEALCAAEQAALDEARGALAAIEGELSAATAATASAEEAVTTARQAYASATAALDAVASDLIALQERLAHVQLQIWTTYEEFAALEGGTASFVYRVPWQALLDEYARLNPGTNVRFTPVPLLAADISATARVGGEPSTLPAVLSVSLPEAPAASDVRIGSIARAVRSMLPGLLPTCESGELPVFLSGGSPFAQLMQKCNVKKWTDDFTFGGPLVTKIGLSVVGVCPYLVDGKPTSTLIDVSGHVVVNASYKYPVATEAVLEKLANLEKLGVALEGVRRGDALTLADVRALIGRPEHAWLGAAFGAADAAARRQEVGRELLRGHVAALDRALPALSRALAAEGAGQSQCVAHGTCGTARMPLAAAAGADLANLLVSRLKRAGQALSPDALYLERLGTVSFGP